MIPQYKPLINRYSLAKQINEYILSDGFFTEFKHTKEFEDRLADFLKVRNCIVVNNGTISLSLALLANKIKPGDRVLIPNISMIATCFAVNLIGAHPVIMDIDHNNGCMDIEQAGPILNERNIKAVIYVSLNGRMHGVSKFNKFQKICLKNRIPLIMDNAQSLGSYDSKGMFINCPTMGGIGSFSFSMPKIITTGQGGCLVTNDDKLATIIRKLKDFGRITGGVDEHDQFGINSKFTEMQAIMGLNQLKDIHNRIKQKRSIFKIYKNELKHIKEIKFMENDNATPWFVDIYCERRNELSNYLKENGVGSRSVYPEISSQKVFNRKVFVGLHSKYIADHGLWLPSSMDLNYPEIKFICDKIRKFYK